VQIVDSDLDSILNIMEQEIWKGNATKVIQELQKIHKRDSLSPEESIRVKIFLGLAESTLCSWHLSKTHCLEADKYFTQAIEESKELNNLVSLFYGYINRIANNFFTQKYEEAYEDFKNVNELFDEIQEEEIENFDKIKMYATFAKSVEEAMKVIGGQVVTSGYFENTKKLTLEALSMAEEQNDILCFFGGLNNMVVILWRIGEFDEAFEYGKRLKDLAVEYENKILIAYSYGVYTGYYSAKGDYEKTLEYLLMQRDIYEELGVENLIAKHNNDMGFYFLNLNKFDEAQKHFEISYKHFKKENDEIMLAFSSDYLGRAIREKGDLEKALEHFLEAYEILSTKKPEFWWNILNSLASVYLLKGELDKALEFQNEQIEFYRQSEYTAWLSYALQNKGKILWQKGKKNQALETTFESLKLTEKSDDILGLAETLNILVYYLIELEKLEEAKEYFKQTEKIASETDDKIIKFRCKFSNASILKESTDEKDKIKAEVLLEDLLKEQLGYSFHVSVVLAYTELLISNLKQTGDEKNLLKLHKYTSHLFSLAAANKSTILSVEAILLQSKLALIDLDFKRSNQLMNQALKLAEDKGLDRLKKQILVEKSKAKSEISSLENLERDSSLSVRMESVDFSRRINGVKKAGITQDQLKSQEVSSKLFSIKI
jgi:tetratricopeptide (TPR) repeat protein